MALTKLKKEIGKIPEEFREIPLSMIKKIDEMERHMKDLQGDVKRNGTIEIYENGAQKTRRANPALSAYQQEIKNYNATVKALTGYIDKYQEVFKQEEVDDSLDEFFKESENR